MLMLLLANPLNSSPLIFPVIECFHISGFVMAIGTCALIDFRLLNLVMARHQPMDTGRLDSGDLFGPADLFDGPGHVLSEPSK